MASSSSSRPAKLQKLNDMRRSCPFVTQSALQSLLCKIHQEGMPDLKYKRDMKEATRLQLSSMDAYGPLLLEANVATTEGTMEPIWIVNLLSLLVGAYQLNGSWANFFHNAHAKNPSSPQKPWQLLLYSDEVVPGNQLAARQNRKVFAIYASFAQHMTMLQCEDAWFILALLPSTIVAQLEASIGQVFAKIIEATFLGPACDPRNGLYMPHPNGTMDLMLYFDLGGFVQDGLAMKQTFNIKGASGDKFCMFCSNIRSIALELPADTPEEDIPGSNVTKLADCILSTDQEVLQAFQVCKQKSRALSKKHFELWERASGITFSHHALPLHQPLLDSNLLKPISGYIHDWMHTMASQGVMQRSIWLLLSQLDMPWGNIQEFLQLWTLPKAMAKAGKLHDLFAAKRTKFYKENSKFKCTASEAIGLTTMLEYLVNSICVPAGVHPGQCQSFLAMAKVMDMLQAIPLGCVQPPMLQHLGRNSA